MLLMSMKSFPEADQHEFLDRTPHLRAKFTIEAIFGDLSLLSLMPIMKSNNSP